MKIRASLILTAAFFAGIAFAQNDPELEEGLRYVRGLQALRLPDMAELVINELSAKYPSAKAQVAQLKLEADLSRGLFDKVKQTIAAEPAQDSPEVWAMKLSLGDAYYAYGKYPESKGIYEAFFKRYETAIPEALRTMVSEAAYKYAQMLLNLKDREGALKQYRRVLTVPLPEHVARQCKAEMAEVALTIADETTDEKKREELCKDVEKWGNDLLWVQDLWFGKAIVLKAHVAMLRRKPKEAKKLVDDYMPTLTQIHQALAEQEKESGEPLTRVSPMAECRYLLAVMLQEEADRILEGRRLGGVMDESAPGGAPAYDKEEVLALLIGEKNPNGKGRQGNGAYNHFINVYLKYPESQWAIDASERAEQIRMLISEKFGGEIKAQVTPEQTAHVRELQYKDARLLFAQGQIDNAKDRLLSVLNSFPDAPEAIPALGDLARCYISTIVDDPEKNELYADLVIAHLAERFSASSETRGPAGDELVRLGEYWLEIGREDKRIEAYNLFFANYPEHPMCPGYLRNFGEKHFADKDFPAAISYYNQVVAFTNSPMSLDALNRLVAIYDEQNDFTNLVSTLNTYIKRLGESETPGQILYTMRYKLATAHKDIGLDVIRSGTTNAVERKAGIQSLARAIQQLQGLAKELETPKPQMQVTEDDKKANRSLREAALFHVAHGLSQMPAANDDQNAQLRTRAIDTYLQLVDSFPQSPFAPTALIQVGSLYTIMKDAEKAESALGRLQKDYPESSEAKSALPMLADSLMKLGMREEAVVNYRKMFAAGTKYGNSELLRATRALAEAKEYDLAMEGVKQVLAGVKEDDVVMKAQTRLVECEILQARGESAEAVEKLRQFIADYPNLSLMIDANLLLSKAASQAGEHEKDGKLRHKLFNDSIDAMKEVRRRRTNNVEIAQSDIEIGRIMTRRAKAEAAAGAEKEAEDTRGKAAIAYKTLIDNTDVRDLRLAPLLEIAYSECIPLLIEHKMWEMVEDSCSRYLADFPRGKYTGQVRVWRNQALMELGGEVPAAAPAAEEAPGAETK